MEFSEKIVEKYDYQLTTINFGGGFGIAYTTNELPLKIDDALKQMVKEVEKFTENSCFKPKEMFIEPGRSIIGESCIMLYTCGDFKHTYGDKNYLFVDGGMTVSELAKTFNNDYSNQKISALLVKLKNAGKVDKTYEKRVAHFTLV